MKIYVKADNYEGYENVVDESTISELYRVANNEVLPETDLFRLSKSGDCEISESSFEYYPTGTAFGAYVTYTVNLELCDYDINIWDFTTGANTTMINFGDKTRNNYFELLIAIDIKNSEVVNMSVEDADAYEDGVHSDYYSKKLPTVFDFDALLAFIRPYAESAAKEIHQTVSNI